MNNESDQTGASLRLVGRYEPQAVDTFLSTCEQITARHSKAILGRFFVIIEERLMAFAQRARSNDEQQKFDDLLRLLEMQYSELVETFQASLADGFERFGNKQLNTRVADSPTHHDRLTLVDNDVLEENIALSSISYRSEEKVRAELWFLSQRMTALNGGLKVRDHNNPVSPLQFCHALRNTISAHSIQIKEKLLFYKVFEGVLNERYVDLLAELNDYLAEQGILPNLRLVDAVRRDSGGASAAATGAAAAPEILPEGQDIPAAFDNAAGAEFVGQAQTAQYDVGVIQAIRTLQDYLQQGGLLQQGNILQSGSLPATGASSVAAPQASPATASGYSHQQLVEVLQALQKRTAGTQALGDDTVGARGSWPVAENMKQAIVGQLQEQSADGQLDPADMHTIDLVGLLFEYMLSDEQLPDSVKTLLSYLHTPFLKMAFLDASFFEQKDHPARLLLNALAEAGTRWVGNDGSSQYDMFAKIRGVVSTILEKFENDVRLFAELLFEFGAHVKKIARSQDLMEKRAMERFQGEERLREVKVRVNQEVRSRTDGKELPSVVLLLLLQPWSDYLAFLLLRYGEQSAHWANALQAIDEILLSVQAPSGLDDQAHQRRQQAVLGLVEEGLTTIGYDQSRGEKVLEALTSLQKMALQRKKAAPAPPPVRTKLEAEAAKKAGEESKRTEKITAEERRMVENLKMIEFGTWFEFEGGKRVKVAWYNSKSMHYMLVNQVGRQVALKSGLELARDMLAGKAKVIAGSSKPFFERALENILQSLNAKAVQAESTNG